MKLTFCGAAGTVTGSCTLLQAGSTNLLIDCGMFQGRDKDCEHDLPVLEKDIDFLLLTHAHIDHTGRVPLLVKNGFCGNIFCVTATCELCDILLRDSAHINLMETERENRKRERAGKPPIEPDYTLEDVENSLKLFAPIEYGRKVTLSSNVSVRFVDAGHLLGSSSVEVTISEGDSQRVLVFSGDIGNVGQPIINDPTYLTNADYVIMESTYGDRRHPPATDVRSQLRDVLLQTFDRGGNVVIPSFAVGRTQQLLYYLREIYSSGELDKYESCPVYMDSPLAIEATRIYMENNRGYYDDEAIELMRSGIAPMNFPQLRIAVTPEESMQINIYKGPCVIISASGMCDAGRIRHHLKHNLWRKNASVVFIGFQAIGTLGRALCDGANHVRIFGEEINVEATVYQLGGLSAHADQDGLLRWIGSFSAKPRKVFVNHGEVETSRSFAAILSARGYDIAVPSIGESFDLVEESFISSPAPASPDVRLMAFDALTEANLRLNSIVTKMLRGLQSGESSVSDIQRLYMEIDALCDGRENKLA